MGIVGDCAYATNGRTNAALASNVMNSRRFMQQPPPAGQRHARYQLSVISTCRPGALLRYNARWLAVSSGSWAVEIATRLIPHDLLPLYPQNRTSIRGPSAIGAATAIYMRSLRNSDDLDRVDPRPRTGEDDTSSRA